MTDPKADGAEADAGTQPSPPAVATPELKPDAQAENRDTEAKANEDGGPREADNSEAIRSAAELGANASTRRRLRQAGQESLGGAWSESGSRFSGPASFGSGHAIGGHLSTAGRDVNLFLGGPPARRNHHDPGPISSGVLTKIRATHIPGGRYDRLEEKLRGSRIVILRGANATGKRTSALRLLAELAQDDVDELDVKVAEGSPIGFDMRNGAGYLAEGEAGSAFAYHRMAAWAAALREKSAYLVVTTPSTTVVGSDVAEHFLVEHLTPDARAVTRSHLSAAPLDAGESEQLLNHPAVRRHLACAISPGAAADLAQYVLAGARDGAIEPTLESFAHALHRREARRLLGSERLRAHRDRVDLLSRRAAMIAIAVFAELPYTEAMAAAEMLAKRFIALEFPDLGGDGRELFIPWADILSSEPGIVIEESELPIRWGTTALRHVRFIDPHLHGVVLEEIWERYDAVRSPLLEWLADLALRAPDETVKIRAAQVVGRFAIRDFSHVCSRQIADWAASVNERHRETAATALEAAADGRYEHVLDLIDDWCNGGNQHRQRSAILALGTSIGDRDPRWTLIKFQRLIQRGPGNSGRPVAEAVRRSLIDLMSGPHLEHVVASLARWAGDKDARLSSLARRCVPSLAHVTNDDDRASFLAALAATPGLRVAAVTLFAAALSGAETRQESWEALERLACAAAREAGLVDVFGEVLHGLSQHPDISAGQVVFYLRLWTLRHEDLRMVTGSARAGAPVEVEA